VARLAVILALLACAPAWAAGNAPLPAVQGMTTGHHLPRFAALKAGTANLRRGPGLRYPIDWVYHRRFLPVLIIREYYAWREVRTPDHQTGWVHASLLTPARCFFVGKSGAVMRASPDASADAIAVLQPGVVGELLQCDGGSPWCRAEAAGYRGYLSRSEIWGVTAEETVLDQRP
jgi:SH3-like domain-containing protein